MPTNRNGFKEAFLEALDEVLQSVLGESGKIVVYFQFQNTRGLRREKIPEKPELFAEFLDRLFGFGAKIIEDEILKSLCNKLGIIHEENKNGEFTDYLTELAKKVAVKNKRVYSKELAKSSLESLAI